MKPLFEVLNRRIDRLIRTCPVSPGGGRARGARIDARAAAAQRLFAVFAVAAAEGRGRRGPHGRGLREGAGKDEAATQF